jgi:hypothetical protein
VTNLQSSPDTIRLWLERSGRHVPLDIELFLQVKPTLQAGSSASPTIPAPAPLLPISPPTIVHPYVSAVSPVLPIPTITPGPLPPAQTPIIVPPSPSHTHHINDGWASPPLSVTRRERERRDSKEGCHWGHIVIWYLVQQISRWERFVFRFEKQFHSMSALKSIVGMSDYN